VSLALCVIAGGKSMAIATALFSLSWTHSVEKTEWAESWRVTPEGLELTKARVKGSGAGMDPGEGAQLEDGWWVWSPDLPIVPELVLASSGATVSAWKLCHAGGCMDLGAKAGEPLRVRSCQR
jgi:hypothetical protein